MKSNKFPASFLALQCKTDEPTHTQQLKIKGSWQGMYAGKNLEQSNTGPYEMGDSQGVAG